MSTTMLSAPAIALRLSNSSRFHNHSFVTAGRSNFELKLINKTNQFNTTGRRWSKQECIPAVVGVVVVRSFPHCTVVMSCRVIGMEIEIAALSEILRAAREGGFGNATASLVAPELNRVCAGMSMPGAVQPRRRSMGPSAAFRVFQSRTISALPADCGLIGCWPPARPVYGVNPALPKPVWVSG